MQNYYFDYELQYVAKFDFNDQDVQSINAYIYAKQKYLGCKKGEANQKQQLSDYGYVCSYMQSKTLISSLGQELASHICSTKVAM